MECNQWTEKGLLFMAGELDEKETRAFNNHLESCDFCRKELRLYQEEKNSLFKPEMFEEAPSSAVDKEIIRVCSQPIKPTVTFTAFPSFLKRTIFALLILAIGFGGGAYFTTIKIASEVNKREQRIADKNKPIQEQKPYVSPSKVVSSKLQYNEASFDSAGSNDSMPRTIKRGNLSIPGVVPVDLTDE